MNIKYNNNIQIAQDPSKGGGDIWDDIDWSLVGESELGVVPNWFDYGNDGEASGDDEDHEGYSDASLGTYNRKRDRLILAIFLFSWTDLYYLFMPACTPHMLHVW